jgi:hypothetical protein
MKADVKTNLKQLILLTGQRESIARAAIKRRFCKMKCKNCSKEFKETSEEVELRKKISPTIGERNFELSEPDKCPLCREQNRIAFRNERKLYKRKCDLCNKEIISVYSPDKNYQIACEKCFWSDNNDPMKVGVEYDADKSFFEQFDNLLHQASLLALFRKNMENSDYANQEEDDKNCYLTVGGHFNEDCCYSTYSINGYKIFDSYFVWKSQNLYECMFCNNCTSGQYLENCQNCSDCYLCESCIGCQNCFGCVNLNHKQYYFFNEPLEQNDYKQRVSEVLSGKETVDKARQKFKAHSLKFPKKFARISKCENSSGEDLTNCKNVNNSFSIEDSDDCNFLYLAGYIKDCQHTSSLGWAELSTDVSSSTKLNNCLGLTHCISLNDCYYCSNCQNSNHLFGCVGLNHKEYCILNKQYTKEEYEDNIEKIVEKMINDDEWGRFFPTIISPFGYNETVAMEYFPLDQNEVIRRGWKWQDNDFGIKYDGSSYQPKEISVYDPKQNPEAQKEIDECLEGIFKCERSGRPFKIIPQELAQYVEQNIQLPRRHPDQRHLDRLAKINPWKLYHGKCMNEGCQNEFETTYGPERPEKIFCEECYQKSII